jgi:uncharacterized protein YoaH (UPF0181 family)
MIKINQGKAIELVKDKIRVWRESEFKSNDLKIQNALVDGSDTTELIARRDWLRNLTKECENKTVQELQDLMTELGI